MAAESKPNVAVLFADKKRLRRIIEEQGTLLNLPYDPTATAEEARTLILADGVHPEDNLFSCGIIQAREE